MVASPGISETRLVCANKESASARHAPAQRVPMAITIATKENRAVLFMVNLLREFGPLTASPATGLRMMFLREVACEQLVSELAHSADSDTLLAPLFREVVPQITKKLRDRSKARDEVPKLGTSRG